MLKEIIATGNNIEEAQEAAAQLLGADASANIEYEIISLPKKKTFGLFGGSLAKVRAYINLSPDLIAKEYLEKILRNMNISAQVTIEENESGAQLRMSGDDSLGTLIGRRGETLDALQYLCSLTANQSSESYFRITLNAGTYREKRQRTLESLARRIASSSIKTGRNTTLEPMSSYERRIIHTTIQDMKGVSSWSVGEGDNRRVIIGVSKDAKFSRPVKDSRPPRQNNNRPSKPTQPSNPSKSETPNRSNVKDVSDTPLYGRIDK